MTRSTRYQGVIIRDHHILLIKQTEHASGRSYWLIPGGGIEPDETEEMCVQREMQEETCLHVHAAYLLLDEPSIAGESYQRRKTYLERGSMGRAVQPTVVRTSASNAASTASDVAVQPRSSCMTRSEAS